MGGFTCHVPLTRDLFFLQVKKYSLSLSLSLEVSPNLFDGLLFQNCEMAKSLTLVWFFFRRGAMGIMLVYDITNAKSFDNIAKWLRNIQVRYSF